MRGHYDVPMQLSRATLGVAILTMSSSVCAEEVPAAEPLGGGYGTRRDPHAYRHDGFYLRFASGFGAYDERLSSESSALYGGEIRGRNRGIAAIGELAVGGTVGEGWVIGGGLYSADMVASTFKRGDDGAGGVPAELDPELRNLALLGPFFDWYSNPERGFHFQAALGIATLTPRVFGDPATERSEYLAIGGGLMLGAGWDFWVDEDWSVGVLARTTVAVLTGRDEADVRWLHVSITSPSLLVTLTYH
jgi:hypothetical protein